MSTSNVNSPAPALARVPRKARAVLDRLLATRQITEKGLNWLVCATDPFHDTEINCDGYPDVSSSRSIVQVVTKTVSISTPEDVSGAWDAHIFFAPLTPCYTQASTTTRTVTQTCKGKPVPDIEECHLKCNNVAMKNGGRAPKTPDTVTSTTFKRSTITRDGWVSQASPGLDVCSGWNIMTVESGTDWSTGDSGASNQTVGIDPTYVDGAWRLIGTGCEVVNTTAELYKGGAVINYRSPSSTSYGTLNPSGFDIYINTPLGLLPPTNTPDAQTYPNSRTWEAEKGTYMIATLNDVDNDYYVPMPGISGLVTPSSYTQLAEGAGWVGYLPALGGSSWQSALASTLPFDITGCVFSGLANQSTLQVTTRYYFERNPTIANSNLLVLSRAPSPYDSTALEIYARVMNEMPVAVPVGENPMGEWFNDVIDAVANWAPKIGTALGSIGVPLAAPIGQMVGAFASRRGQPPPVPPKPRPAPAPRPQQKTLAQNSGPRRKPRRGGRKKKQ